MIPEINRVHRDAAIIVYSAYVTKTYLRSKLQQFDNVTGFFGKPEGVKHRKELYWNAVRNSSATLKKQNAASPGENAFDYSVVDKNLSVYLHEKADKIKRLIKRSAQDLVDIGESLIDVKEKLEYGQYYIWLETEFGWSYRTAHRLVNVAERFRSVNLSDLNIIPSALYELSAPSVPEAATEEAVLRAQQGETISPSVAKKIKSKYKPASKTRKIEDSSISSGERTRSKQPVNRETTPNILQKRSQILKVIRQERVWQLGKHLLYCGEPNSPEFVKHLPTKISLNLAFPSQENWFFSFDKVDSSINFYSKYQQDLDIRLLSEAVERLIKITTDDNDDTTICFMPDPAILLLAHKLGCRCFIAEPDLSKCEAIRAVWAKL